MDWSADSPALGRTLTIVEPESGRSDRYPIARVMDDEAFEIGGLSLKTCYGDDPHGEVYPVEIRDAVAD